MNITIRGERELREAFQKNPQYVKSRGGQLITRLKTAYQRQIIRDPWRVGASGGGVPVDTGSLRDSHRYIATQTRLEIEVPDEKADAYGRAVHRNRPWLDYAHEKLKKEREKELSNFLKDITNNLAE
jgi:hypothetical protein